MQSDGILSPVHIYRLRYVLDRIAGYSPRLYSHPDASQSKYLSKISHSTSRRVDLVTSGLYTSSSALVKPITSCSPLRDVCFPHIISYGEHQRSRAVSINETQPRATSGAGSTHFSRNSWGATGRSTSLFNWPTFRHFGSMRTFESRKDRRNPSPRPGLLLPRRPSTSQRAFPPHSQHSLLAKETKTFARGIKKMKD